MKETYSRLLASSLPLAASALCCWLWGRDGGQAEGFLQQEPGGAQTAGTRDGNGLKGAEKERCESPGWLDEEHKTWNGVRGQWREH